MRRVVVTGMGAITPVGNDVDTTFGNLLGGRHGFSRITSFDCEELGVTYAGQIKDFEPTLYGMSKKDARRMDPFIQFATAASYQAMQMSGYTLGEEDPYKAGVIVGSGIGGFHTFSDEHVKYLDKGPSRVSVFFIPMMIINMAAGSIAINYNFRGLNYGTVSACSSGAHAVGEAYRAIRHGYLDCALAGGSECCVDCFSMSGFNNMLALTRSDDPDRLSIPFDKERSGFVMAEGAGILFLEEYEHAKRRGANILGEIVGYGATNDAYHITAPRPDGSGGAKAMELALQEAGIAPDQVGYINAHGTSTQMNDVVETMAIHSVFGDTAKKVAVSSTKSMTGHMLGAAGAVEAIVCVKALQEGIVPPTIGYRCPDEECDLDYVTEGARKVPDLRYALSNSLGFGGHNATLCFKRAEED